LIPIQATADGVIFAIKVHPHARKNAITGETGDALKVSLTAPPIDGKANDACNQILLQAFEAAAIFRYYCLRP
jgi:uncharacterized protein